MKHLLKKQLALCNRLAGRLLLERDIHKCVATEKNVALIDEIISSNNQILAVLPNLKEEDYPPMPKVKPVKEDFVAGEIAELKKPIDTARIINTLDWMVNDMKWRADETKRNFEEGSQGGYSPELTEAINLLEELQDGI